MADCEHPVQLRGLCAICGADTGGRSEDQPLENVKNNDDDEDRLVHILHGNLDLRVSKKEANRIEIESQRRLLAERKLSLVIDLDQTILHATTDPLVAEWIHNEAHPNHPFVRDVAQIVLADSLHTTYYIKFRPLLSAFLTQMARLFELHIYTMGSHSYARQVVQQIDPHGVLFGDRILSRDLAGIPENRKELKRIFPCDDRTVLVIDDRADVWNYSDNLIQVSPYCFFVGTGDVHALQPPEHLNPEGCEAAVTAPTLRDDDCELARIQKILQQVHHEFFQSQADQPDVKHILSGQRKAILKGAIVAFSGLFPQEMFPLWRLALSLGAECRSVIMADDKAVITHLITTRTDTSKVRQAARIPTIHIVSPAWIYECAQSWSWVPEDAHLVPVDRGNTLRKGDLDQINQEIEECLGESSSSEDPETGLGEKRMAPPLDRKEIDSSSSILDLLDRELERDLEDDLIV